jgi:hypothetical protein
MAFIAANKFKQRKEDRILTLELTIKKQGNICKEAISKTQVFKIL